MSTALITGGGKGIGLAVVERLLASEWSVIVVDQDREAGGAAAALSTRVTFAAADVTDPEGMAAVAAAAAREHGAIDALVTCAGITVVGPSETFDVEDWRRVLDIDLTGTFISCQAASRHMPDGSSIVTLSSIAALRGMPERAAYVAAKAGVVGLTKALAAEWAGRGIRVNSVAPSWVDTPFLRDAADKGYVDLDELSRRPPLKRMAQTGDIAGAVEFLLGGSASFITGQTLYVDGGFSWAS